MFNNIRSKLTYSEVSIMELYIFCSDDRKARSVMSNQSIDCVSALASFYLAKNYLHMSKEYAQVFFDSWMALHRNQKCFQIYSESGVLYLLYKEKNTIHRFDLYCIISLDVGS